MTLSVTAAPGWTRRASRSWPSATAEPSTVCIWCRSAATGRSQRVWNATCEHRGAARAPDLFFPPWGRFLGLAAAADVGGVGGPVSGGGVLPGDGDADVDAEHPGEDGCGKFGGELEKRGGACLRWVDADGFEPVPEVAGADRPAGLAAGEQPWRGCAWSPMAAWPRRVAARYCWVKVASGSGSVTGAWPRRIVTWVPAGFDVAGVSRVIAGGRWA